MANKQHGTRQKLVFRGDTRPARPATGATQRRDARPQPPTPAGGKPARPAPRRQPRKLIGSSDS